MLLLSLLCLLQTRFAGAEKAVLFSTASTQTNSDIKTTTGYQPTTGDTRHEWGFSKFSSSRSPDDGWVFDNDFSTSGRFYVCDTQNTGTQNWLKSPFIETQRISRIEVKIMYAQVACTKYPHSNPECSNQLKVFYLEASGANDHRQLDETQYESLSKTIEAESYLNGLDDTDDSRLFAHFDSIQINENIPGIFLMIGDRGSCSVIFSVELTYFVCPEIRKDLVVFPQSVVGRTDKEVFGRCVSDASRDNPPRATCRFYGEWEFHNALSKNCQCDKGYEPTSNMSSCKPCDLGFFKSRTGNHFCSVCPMNSYSSRSGSSTCQCKDRFFRGINDSSESSCEEAPPAPRSLQYEVKNTVVKLFWEPPVLPGLYQRRNICFQVKCRLCPLEVVEEIENKCMYTTEVTLYDLKPETDYIFDVYSMNSITINRLGLANSNSIQVKTGKLARVRDLLVDLTAHQGVKLSWKCDTDSISNQHHNPKFVSPGLRQGSPQNQTSVLGIKAQPGIQNSKSAVDLYGANSQAASVVFEVKLTWRGEPHATFTTSSTSYATSDLQPGFWGFQVCIEGVKATCSDVVTREIQHSQIVFDSRHVIALGGIGTTIVFLVIITLALSVWCIRNNLNSPPAGQQIKWPSQGDRFHQGSMAHPFGPNHSPDYNSSLGISSDDWMTGPGAAQTEFPVQMLDEWNVQHITLNRIEFEKTENPNYLSGLPDLVRARLSDHTFSQTCPTMIKRTVPKNYADLGLIAHETATCSQFQHPNILFLYGVALNGPEMLICLEYTAKGTLDRVIKDISQSASFQTQVMHLLRGVANGMQFFADMGYVHKVLTSENVYVTEGEVCKIAGFDTRAALEAEEAENSNCTVFSALIPWLAPEVSAGIQNPMCRQYSLMSDIWSFGVLIWECLSTEKPFFDWHPLEIIRATTSRYRLPIPGNASASLGFLMMQCWNENPTQRIFFSKILTALERLISNPVEMEDSTLSFLGLYSTQMRDGQYMMKNSNGSAESEHEYNAPCTPATSIEDWLRHLNMPHCASKLQKVDRNYLTIGDIINIDSKTLKSLGINHDDRKVILKSLEGIASAFHRQAYTNSAKTPTIEKKGKTTNIAHSII